MRNLLVILILLIAVANAQLAFSAMPLRGVNGMGMITGGGGQYGISGVEQGGMGGYGGGWGRRRMMGGMMNPYMGMMYGRR